MPSTRVRSVTVIVPAPAPWVRSNDHGTAWRTRARLTCLWRHATAVHARQGHAAGAPFPGPVTIRGTIWKPTLGLFDLDGHAPTLKACIDGLRDAELINGDDWRHVPELTLAYGGKGTPRIVITITPEPKS